ncbi:hypothetical protein HDK64DRAFT_312604 [Phyllosticta capitalensis]
MSSDRQESYDSDEEAPSNVATGGMFVAGLMDGANTALHEPVDVGRDHDLLYMSKFKRTFMGVAQDIGECIRREQYHGQMYDKQLSDFSSHAMMMLCAAEKELVMSIIDGTLPRRAIDNTRPRTKRFLQLTKEESDVAFDEFGGKMIVHQPVIFGQYLVNDEGLGPTGEELERILAYAKLYMDPGHPVFEEYVKRVNAVCSKDCSKLPRAAVDSLYRWSTELMRGLPITTYRPPPMANYVYSPTPKSCDKNRLVCLIEAICKLYFPRYTIHEHIVFRIFAPQQAWFGEQLFNRISVSDTYGFSYKAPAKSTYRAADIASKHYYQWQYNATHFTPIMAMFEVQCELWKQSPAFYGVKQDQRERPILHFMREALSRMKEGNGMVLDHGAWTIQDGQ